MAGLGRAIRYLGRYKRAVLLAYASLLVSTGAMLMVPQLVQNIIDAVTNGLIAGRLSTVPVAFQPQALKLLGWTAEKFARYQNGAESALLWAGGLIVVFAVIRGAFAFSQNYMSEKLSQSVAFDFRNELFAKIQRLSFSYHDRNQTGQLMIRATDDVEKVRLFIGQGLLMAAQALVMLIGDADHPDLHQPPADAGHPAGAAAGPGHLHGLRRRSPSRCSRRCR